jgi:hypothetical protein
VIDPAQAGDPAGVNDRLQWEARFSRPAAIAAFGAGLLLMVGTVALQSIFEDRNRIEPLPDFLLSIDEAPNTLLASAGLEAASSLLLVGVFYYLFRATIHRAPAIPSWFSYLIFIGPVFLAISQVIGAIDRVDVAELFAQQSSNVGDCPALRGEPGEECANDLLREDVNPVSVALGLAGSVGTAFLFVMLPLRARRAGLLSQFMSILGVIAGVLMVLQLMPLVPEIIEAFWLGAVGALFLGNWPGGRGPAWESGQPDPWPSAAERRGLMRAGDDRPGGDNGASAAATSAEGDPPEPEEVPARPSSRKRRRKRR